MSFTLSVLLAAITAGISSADEESVLLADAIAAFNVEAATDPIGKSQPPLTEEEVITAILLWERPDDSPVSNEMLATFQSIAKTGRLPARASFEKLTGYDRGGNHVFDVWSVRIQIERPDKSSYSFVLRERAIANRTLEEELNRLEQLVSTSPDAGRFLLWHRDRIENLRTRIAAARVKQ